MQFCKLRFCFGCLWYDMICIFKSMWFSHTTRCIILLRLEVCTKVAAFEWKNKMGSSHKLQSLANPFRIFRLSPAFHAKSKSCPRPIQQQDSSMLLQHRSFVWPYIVNYMNIIISCWGRCASWNSCTSFHKFTSIIFWSSWAPPFGARRSHGAVKRCPWAAPNVAPRPRRHAAPWRRHHRRPGLEAPPADRPLRENIMKTTSLTNLTIKIYPKYLIYFHLLPSISKCNCLHTSTYSCVLSRIHMKMASKLFWF